MGAASGGTPPDGGPVPDSVHAALAGTGRPLDAASRTRFEPWFGSMAGLRIHTDSAAADSAREVGALAYAAGRHVVFAEGQFAPHTPAGERLLAHELAHVAQQANAPASAPVGIGARDDVHERNADQVADAVTRGGPAPGVIAAPALVQRQPPPPQSTGTSPAATLYAQALPLVQAMDRSVYDLLSKAPLGGGPKQVAQSTIDPSSPGGPPGSITFELEVVLASLPPNVDAQFDARGSSMTRGTTPAGGVQATLRPAILVNSALLPSATAREMAETLVHEGTHLQIMMDPLLNVRSRHFDKFQRYKTVGEQQGAELTRKLDFYIDLVLTRKNAPGNTPENRLKDAKKVISLLVEEKYVYDQDVSRIGKLRSNRQIAADYIPLGLDGVGIPRSAQPAAETSQLVQSATDFLDTLDRWVHNLPPQTGTPDLIAPPLPVIPR